MSGSDLDRATRAWLEDGPRVLSDRVLQAALDEVHLTPQRRRLWPAWRTPMNGTLSKAIAGIAAVLVVGAVGFNLMSNVGSPGPGGPAPTPTASPTAAPSATPTPTPTPIPSGFVVGPGEITLMPSPGSNWSVRLTIPAGWQGTNGEFGVFKEESADGPPAPAIATWDVETVYGDGCQWQGTEIDVGPTVDDLANAFASLTDREVTGPTDVTYDGYSGKELGMTIPDVPFADCDGSEFRSWTNSRGDSRYHQAQLEHARIVILDVDGERVFIFSRTFADTTQLDHGEIDTMLETMQIETAPAS